VGEAVDQAKRERELSKAALSADLERLESQVRAGLDWKARLRRDGARYAVIATVVVVVVAGGFVLRRFLGGSDPEEAGRSGRHVGTIDDIAEQLREIRKELDGRRGGTGPPLWHKVVLRGTTAAGAAAGSIAARQLMDRYTSGDGHWADDVAAAPLAARDAAGR